MTVGGAFGIVAKGTVNRLMKVSLRRGERKATPQSDSELPHKAGFPPSETRVNSFAKQHPLLVSEPDAGPIRNPVPACCSQECDSGDGFSASRTTRQL